MDPGGKAAEPSAAAESPATATPTHAPAPDALRRLHMKEAEHARMLMRPATEHGFKEVQRMLSRDATQWMEQGEIRGHPDDTLKASYDSERSNARDMAVRIATLYFAKRDYTKSRTWCTRAQGLGDKRGPHNLAVLELQKAQPDLQAVVVLMQEAAFVQSYFCIALITLQGRPLGAKLILEKLASAPRKHMRATFVLGVAHMNELFGDASSMDDAKKFLAIAGEAGTALAWRHLALLQKTLGEPFATTAKKGADAHDVGCCEMYGRVLCTGADGVKKDLKLGGNYLSHAATNGSVSAKYMYYSLCFGKKKEHKQYVDGIRDLAEKEKYPPALHDLTLILYAGKYDVTRNPASGAKALRAAVETGFIPSIIFAITNEFIVSWHRHYARFITLILRVASNGGHMHQSLAKDCCDGMKICIRCANKLTACNVCAQIYCLKCNGEAFEGHVRAHAAMAPAASNTKTGGKSAGSA